MSIIDVGSPPRGAGLVLAVLAVAVCLRFIYRLSTSRYRTEVPTVKIEYLDHFVRVIFRQSSGHNLGWMDETTKGMNETGWNTYQWKFLGWRALMTRDPKNIQAMLATGFGDFQMGVRNYNFRPGLGRGIFTTDGEEW